MSGDHGHSHDGDGHGHHPEPLAPVEARVAAIESVLVEKGVLDTDALDQIVQHFEENLGPMNGAKVVALTVLDLLTRPELVSQAWDYFRNVQTKEKKYIPLIRPQDQPAIWLNKERMEKYRPEMRKYYYDPTKYKTYLDQLGIKYPTVKPATSSPQQQEQ